MFKGSKLENETKLQTVNEGNPTEIQLMQQKKAFHSHSESDTKGPNDSEMHPGVHWNTKS